MKTHAKLALLAATVVADSQAVTYATSLLSQRSDAANAFGALILIALAYANYTILTLAFK